MKCGLDQKKQKMDLFSDPVKTRHWNYENESYLIKKLPNDFASKVTRVSMSKNSRIGPARQWSRHRREAHLLLPRHELREILCIGRKH